MKMVEENEAEDQLTKIIQPCKEKELKENE